MDKIKPSKRPSSRHELYHEIFGSIIEREEMTPYLLLKADVYKTAMKQAARVMGNRGFDIYKGNDLESSEKKRALEYIEKAYSYCFRHLFPFIISQLALLKEQGTKNTGLYEHCLKSVNGIKDKLNNRNFKKIISEDPRHIFLMASSKKYPHLFYGYKGGNLDVLPHWQQTACSVLKVAYLIKSIEEDSQDINDYSQLGLFLAMEGQSLDNLYHYNWEKPEHIPDSDAAKRAFVKVSIFFHKLKESLTFNEDKKCLTFKSGDGVNVEIAELKARLKSPESMFTKLGKNVKGDVHDIRDILAITFILERGDDVLKLFHALQKRGVILQENTISSSITQTLFKSPEDMMEAVRQLEISVAKSGGAIEDSGEQNLLASSEVFYNALSANAAVNSYSSLGHRKFQCKINYSVPIHRNASTNEIMIPGTSTYSRRTKIPKKTEQHTLAIELRISDRHSWRESEQAGDAHHEAYKFRQMAAAMNRLFKGSFSLPEEAVANLREDQNNIFT